MFNFRPYKLIIVFYILFSVIELVLFKDFKKKNKVKLVLMKAIPLVLPYVICVLLISNEAHMFPDYYSKYFRDAMAYENEIYVLSWVFLGLTLLIEYPLFLLLTSIYENKKALRKKYIVLNLVFFIILLICDYVLCVPPNVV